MVAFPPTPAPAYYTTVTPGQPHGAFAAGGAAPFVTLSKSGADTYTVRDYFGNIVSTGAVTGLTVTPAAPAGGWIPGWYRIYLTGPSTDALFGPAYGSSVFFIYRPDSRFPAFINDTADGQLSVLPLKASLGAGTSRLQVSNADTPASGSLTLASVQATVATSKSVWNVGSGSPYYDAARPRLLFMQFPNGTTDSVTVGGLRLYPKDETVDGSTVTVTAVAGTTSGTKLTVNGETYDNLASADAAVTAVNAASFLVKAFGTGSLPTAAAQTVGRAFRDGVTSVVSALYPDVTRFEGPSNEPTMNAETAHRMRLFAAAVHAGNAAAKATGPAPVNITAATAEPFFAAGGGAYCDEVSVHAYNSQINGDINPGRTQIAAFFALLAKYGLGGKTVWQTESTQVMTSVYGVYHPRRARQVLLQTLLWEQFGVPRERNGTWYDASHGFWTYPTWLMMGDGTVNPYGLLLRVLSEETFGQTHASALSFGAVGDRIFLGSVYSGASGSTAVIMAQSYMPGSTVTLNVTGTTSPLTVADGFGNLSTVTISGGKAAVPATEIPTYVRLPVGVSVTVATCNDWPTNQTGWVSSAVARGTAVTGTVSPSNNVVDGGWMTQYTGTAADGVARGTTMPDTATLTWPAATRVDRVIAWGGCWQGMSALVDFDVQTSVDGTTWATQATVTKTAPSSFQFGANSTGTGCQQETFWDEQWIYDVKLPAPVTCKAVRLNVRATSYGGEPDAAANTTGGQGASAQYITLQELAVLCDNNTAPHYSTK